MYNVHNVLTLNAFGAVGVIVTVYNVTRDTCQ